MQRNVRSVTAEMHLKKRGGVQHLGSKEIPAKPFSIQQRANAQKSTTLAILGPSHLGNIVEMVQLHETGSATLRSTIVAGVSGATILTLSPYMASILLFSNERELQILRALRHRRMLWDTMRLDHKHRHADISIHLRSSQMMANFGYVLTKGSIAQFQNGSTVEVVENEQLSILASLKKGGQSKSTNATYYLTAKSARERRRAAEVLMREGEYKVAVPMFNLAHELFASASKLLSESTSAVDEAVRVVQSGFTRVISMCSAFSALAAFVPEEVEAIRCANKIFVIAVQCRNGAFTKTHQE